MAKETQPDAQLGWIYEGTKAMVNREDYLLGKKVDKNFEMYSDAVVRDKESHIDALLEAKHRSSEPSTSKTSNLGVNIIRNEDPLVSIKMKEEKLRMEMMENPLVMLKMQKVLKEAMKKKERKLKKEKKPKSERKKHKKKGQSRDDEGGTLGTPSHRTSRSESTHNSSPGKRRNSKENNREGGQKRRHRSSNSEGEPRSVRKEQTRTSTELHNHALPRETSEDIQEHVVDRSRSDEFSVRQEPSSSKEDGRKVGKARAQRDAHIPEHLRPKYSESSSSSSSESEHEKHNDEEKERSARFSGYGLVGVKKGTQVGRDDGSTENPYKHAFSKPTVDSYKKEKRQKLSREEMEAKRKEMMQNAQWRDAVRSSSLKRAARSDEAEERSSKGKPVDFIRPMLNRAASTMSVEQRLSSQRQNLQRTVGYMEQKFANR